MQLNAFADQTEFKNLFDILKEKINKFSDVLQKISKTENSHKNLPGGLRTRSRGKSLEYLLVYEIPKFSKGILPNA